MKKLFRPLSTAIVIVLCLVVLTACGSSLPDTTSPSAEKLCLAGIVTTDGNPLADVAVFVNGTESARTDTRGVFSLTELSKGDTVSFLLDGYSFSPASYTLTASVNDLRVAAYSDAHTGDDENPVGENPDDENPIGENPDDTPEEPVALFAPSGTGIVFSGNSVLFVTDVDARAETVTFAFSRESETVSGTALLSDRSVTVGNLVLEMAVAAGTERDTVTLNVTALTDKRDGVYGVGITTAAQGFLSSSFSTTFECRTSPPAVSAPALSNGVLSWTGTALPDGVSFVVLVNGVKVATVRGFSADVSAVLSSLSDTARACVVAMCDGVAIAVSPTVTV